MKVLLPGMTRKKVPDYDLFTHKRCNKCLSIKPVNEFAIARNKNAWRYTSECKQCLTLRQLVLDQDPVRKAAKRERMKQWHINLPKRPETQRAYRERIRIANIKHKYGLSERQLKLMETESRGLCKLCGKSGERLVIDHCHETGRVRGLICKACNMVVGIIEKYPHVLTRIPEYIKKHEPALSSN